MLSNFNLCLRQVLRYPDDDTLALIALDAGQDERLSRIEARSRIEKVRDSARWMRLVREVREMLTGGNAAGNGVLNAIRRTLKVPTGWPMTVRVRLGRHRPVVRRFAMNHRPNMGAVAVVVVGVRWVLRTHTALAQPTLFPDPRDFGAGWEGGLPA